MPKPNKYEIIFPEGYVKPLLPKGKQWVAALRSGEYTQLMGRLCSIHSMDLDDPRVPVEAMHCCLGVWCEVNGYTRVMSEGAVFYTVQTEPYGMKNAKLPRDGTLLANGRFPADVFCEMVVEPGQLSGHQVYNFYDLNDTCNFTFAEIADVAEKIYELGD